MQNIPDTLKVNTCNELLGDFTNTSDINPTQSEQWLNHFRALFLSNVQYLSICEGIKNKFYSVLDRTTGSWQGRRYEKWRSRGEYFPAEVLSNQAPSLSFLATSSSLPHLLACWLTEPVPASL